MSDTRFQTQPRTHFVIFFWCGATARTGRFSTFFPAQLSGGDENEPHFLRDGAELNQLLKGHKTVIGASLVCFRFQMHCFLS